MVEKKKTTKNVKSKRVKTKTKATRTDLSTVQGIGKYGFAKTFKEFRQRHGLSQMDMAKIAGVNISLISAVENEIKPPFSYKTLSKIFKRTPNITRDEIVELSEYARMGNPTAYPIPCDVISYFENEHGMISAVRKGIYG